MLFGAPDLQSRLHQTVRNWLDFVIVVTSWGEANREDNFGQMVFLAMVLVFSAKAKGTTCYATLEGGGGCLFLAKARGMVCHFGGGGACSWQRPKEPHAMPLWRVGGVLVSG